MKTNPHYLFIALALLALSTFNFQLSTAVAQGTAFTYQGELQNNGRPANGTYSLTFTLFDTNLDGAAIAGPVTNNAVIVTNGLFTVQIDFGAGLFTGGTNWLQMGVETNSASPFTPLVPRQQLTATPYAIFAENATMLANGVAIGAGSDNTISSSGATDSFIGGGSANAIELNSVDSVIGGGQNDIIQPNAGWSVIGGGEGNATYSGWSVIAGGNGNVVGSGTLGGSIGGGYNNSNNGNYATVPGGAGNVASGAYSFAAGDEAQAINTGSFVWADAEKTGLISSGSPFSSTANNQFSVRAGGGVVFVTGGAGMTLDGLPVLQGGVSNSISVGSPFSLIGSGQSNAIQLNSPWSFIGGGSHNLIEQNSPYSFVGGGYNNTAVGYGATVVGGGVDSEGDFFDNNASGDASFVGGGMGNSASGEYSTVGGGGGTTEDEGGYIFPAGNTASGPDSTVSGGLGNRASGAYSTVSGGGGVISTDGNPAGNNASGVWATVGGGVGNTASGEGATVAGGGLLVIGSQGNTASGEGATVAGGVENNATNYSSTVPGGQFNIAGGLYSFAAGNSAEALYDGDFVWADDSQAGSNPFFRTSPFAATSTNQFLIRAQGGVGINTASPQQALSLVGGMNIDQGAQNIGNVYSNALTFGSASGEGLASKRTSGGSQYDLEFYTSFNNRMIILNNGDIGIGTTSPGALLQVGSATCNGTTWVNGSDRNSKEDFAVINPREVLAKVAALPITEWKYKVEADGTEHLGPMAQDFHVAFGLNGADDKHIATVDEEGVALAAIQGLNQRLNDKDAQIQTLKQQNDSLAERLNELEAAVKQLVAQK